MGLDSPIEKIFSRDPVVCGVNDPREKITCIAAKNRLYQIPIVGSDGRLVRIEDINKLISPQKKITGLS